jgi:hypothetical protein
MSPYVKIGGTKIPIKEALNSSNNIVILLMCITIVTVMGGWLIWQEKI